MDSHKEKNPIVALFFLIVSLLILCGVLTDSGKEGSSRSTPSGKPSDMSTGEWNYVTNRVQQDTGVTHSDAEVAARTVWKFHQAQEARGSR